MRQFALTLIAQVKDNGLEPLRQVLKNRETALMQALGGIGTIHYARWVIIEPSDGYKAVLAFASNYDGHLDTHIKDLVGALGPLLDDIYTHCEDYTPADKTSYLLNIRHEEAAFYQGSPGRTVATIAQEKALRDRLVRAVEAGNWTGKTAKQIHAAVKQEVLAEPAFAWAKDRLKTPGVNYLVLSLLVILLLLVLPLTILLLAVFALWAVYMQFFHEIFDEPGTTTPNQVSDHLIAENVRAEDYSYQNQFSQIMLMKPGPARLFTLNLFFFLTRILIRLYFVKGKLLGIPTIHFARWVLLDDNKRLLFFSNFDGSWTQYLGDFIDKAGWGLNAIFGNTQVFPRIWFFFWRGAYNEMDFLGWSRSTQIPTQIWYAASVDQSIKNINDNTITRNALSRDLSERQAQKFLAGL
jgi:hypothetical protein